MGYLVGFLCVVGLSAGQLLLKYGAQLAAHEGTYWASGVIAVLLVAVGLYGCLFLTWFWVVGNIGLSRAYPMVALSFVMVPFGNYIFYGERAGLQYMLGIALVVTGLFVILVGSETYR